MTKVEQIENGKVISDFDERLSRKDIAAILSEDLNIKNDKNPFECKINGKEIKLFVKQITYLGNPHLKFKKRIQISSRWQKALKPGNHFLLGIYKYRDTILYTFFDKSNFLKRATNNSSAHVSTFDLLKADCEGIFTKKDRLGNFVTTIKKEELKTFLQEKVEHADTLSPEISLFESFKKSLKKNYHGIGCYQEMEENKYAKKNQPEWPGFFLEYKFESFLEENPAYKLICRYQSNKKKGEIDLDLNFNNEYYGDLKAHSNDSTAILGNDLLNIEQALDNFGKIWYVVFNHDTVKDSVKEYEVTLFWNQRLQKENLMSYSKKMKNSITFTDFQVLEINNYNKNYISAFNQGHNSNSKERKPKIKIDNNKINNFLIYHSEF